MKCPARVLSESLRWSGPPRGTPPPPPPPPLLPPRCQSRSWPKATGSRTYLRGQRRFTRETKKLRATTGRVGRIAPNRAAAPRDSRFGQMSAPAIRRFDQPRAQPVAPSTCRRAIEAETAERPRRAARARVARSRAARRAHLVAPGHARRISTDPGGVGPSLWPRGSRSAQSPLITGRCWPRAHGGGRRRRRRASPARPRSAGLPAESCRAAPPPPPSAASGRPSATQEGIAPRRIPPSGLLD